MAHKVNSYKRRNTPRGQVFAWKRFFLFWASLCLGIVGVAFILFLFVFVYRWILVHSVWQLREIVVKGNSRVSYQQVLDLAQVRLGQSSLELHIAGIQKTLEQLEWVEDVVVKRVLPDKLQIEMKEKDAFFWVHKGKKLYYADKKGNIICSVQQGQFVTLPVLYVENDVTREVVAEFSELVSARVFPLGLHQIAWVRFWPSGLVEVALLNKTRCLLEGEKLREASCQFAEVWSYLQTRHTAQDVKKIVVIPDRVWVEF